METFLISCQDVAFIDLYFRIPVRNGNKTGTGTERAHPMDGGQNSSFFFLNHDYTE